MLIANPVTLGDKLRNRRLELGLSQSQVAKIFNTDSDLVYMWEKNLVKPTVKRFPQVIDFLGYFPFDINQDSIGGKIKKYRYAHGLSQEKMANFLDIDECTVSNYESGKRTLSRKKQDIIVAQLIPKKLNSYNLIRGSRQIKE